jgi:predicted aldo/keto reductase-like oxidoreductase
MEPLRGGKLVKYLPTAAKEIFDGHPVKRSPAEWGLRWLWNQKEVTVVLSGMNSEAMVQENIRVASEVEIGEQGEEEAALYAKVVKAINENVKVGCTACGYCMPCPKGVDIPGTFAIYNRWYGEDKAGAFKEYLKCTTFRKNSTAASNCIGCGKCEKHCPQGIEIRKNLKEAQKALETPIYKICSKFVGWFAHF